MFLNYKKTGNSGDAIIILHGLLGTLDNWQTVAKKLSNNFQVYCIDQRNHGRSPHSDEMNYIVMAEDVKAFCQQEQIERAIVIGHSMGGKAGMTLALLYPELVTQLIIVDIAPIVYDGGHESILKAMSEAPIHSTSSRNEIELFLKPNIQDFGERQFMLKNLSRKDDNSFYWKCNLNVLMKKYPVLMGFPELHKTFNGRCDFIKGEKSDYISNSNWNKCTEYFPNANLHTILDAGHWVHAENQHDFLLTLVTLLN